MSNVILDNNVLEINLSMSNVQMFCFAVLLNKWEKLLAKIQENIQHTEVYESLKSDILSLREDLARVLADTEQEPGQENVEGQGVVGGGQGDVCGHPVCGRVQ